MEICEFYTVNGRCIVVGDSTKKSKEGRRMMGCKRLHSASDTQSKSSSSWNSCRSACGADKRYSRPCRGAQHSVGD